MSDELELKTIHASSVSAAIAKAEHYRLLNNPAETESICLDVLAVEPKNQKALVVLVLALTDQLQVGKASVRRIRTFLERIEDEYLTAYYTGLLSEREGRACIHRELPGGFAYDCLRQAMDWYEKAEKIAPKDNDEAILRYNSCVRTIRRHRLEPREEEGELPLE